VTHDIDEAIILSDRLYLLSKTTPATIQEVFDANSPRQSLSSEFTRLLKQKILVALSKEQINERDEEG
jgi:ABC-type nitrate/sulfonate/bicarbonate transport system ATPase subunit